MSKFRNFTKIFLITFSLFLTVDFFVGEKLLKKIGIIYLEELIRVPNKEYNYSFKKNINTNFAVWGNSYYKLCTDSRGFKFNCEDKEKSNYKIAFIGDSFVEGIGLPYEKTFVGKFADRSNLEIVNLGVASYSPYIYKKKIKHLILDKTISFNHLIVGVDLTDLEDDWARRQVSDTDKTLVNKKLNFRLFLAKYFPSSYLILKRINWFVKINIIKNTNVSHLDYKKNKASWSYIKNYKNLDEKIEIQMENMNELFEFLKQYNIKLSVLIYPHQASIKFDKEQSLYKKTWKNFCINKCFKFIDAYSIFFDELKKYSKKEVMEKYYIKGDPHFNSEGNEKVSIILYQMLTN